MNLIKYDDDRWNDPFSAFDWMAKQFFGDDVSRSLPTQNMAYPLHKNFRVDMLSDEKAYYIVAELPGVKKDEVDIQLANAVLNISGKYSEGEGDQAHTVKFGRAITVGNDIKTDEVTAKMENGLLNINLPKADSSIPKAITIS